MAISVASGKNKGRCRRCKKTKELPEGRKICEPCSKVCCVCSKHLILGVTYSSHSAKRNRYICNQCSCEASKKRCKDKQREYDYQRNYGISIKDYEVLLGEQRGLCLICSSSDIKLFVDHDHNTGKVRGLLCSTCNTGLGMFKDSVEILNKAKEYLNASKNK